MKTLLLTIMLASSACASAPRVPADGRPSDDEDRDYTRIFIPVEKGDTEICVEHGDAETGFFEDCIEARELHALVRQAGGVP